MTIFNELSRPFAPVDVSWKPGRTAKDGSKALALAYADLRAYQERLDEVCGLDWSVRYTPWGDDRVICELTISGVTRSSTGEMRAQDESNGTGGTVAEAQAFKRAAAMFGLGRCLYKLPARWVEFDAKSKRITEVGLKQLDTEYRSWYVRQVAQGDSQDLDENPFEGDEQPTQEDNIISPAQFTRLHTLGHDFYGSKQEWDTKRPDLCKAASAGVTSSSRELTREQARLLIDGLQKRLNEKRFAANGVPA